MVRSFVRSATELKGQFTDPDSRSALPRFQIVEHGVKVYKGTNPEVDSYSVFWDNKKLSDTSLIAQLKSRGVTDVYVCGLAYDVCVGKHLVHDQSS